MTKCISDSYRVSFIPFTISFYFSPNMVKGTI